MYDNLKPPWIKSYTEAIKFILTFQNCETKIKYSKIAKSL